jgi:alkanesulfonate monooxygenase SsuD/methylene tetrahydromethanopterin reductase-like flavin-dependent oxidoreductase (luciferase family)
LRLFTISDSPDLSVAEENKTLEGCLFRPGLAKSEERTGHDWSGGNMQRWGIGVPPALSMRDIIRLTQQAETTGAESVWVADIGRDIFTVLTTLAQHTTRLRLGAAVAICFARPPALVQLAASDIDELSNGRMVLGLGTAPPAWNENWYNVIKHEKPVARMKEFAQVCRLMWRSSPQHPVNFEGRALQIRGYSRLYPPPRERIPIYFGGMNPRMLKATGEVADGWIGGGITSPRFVNTIVKERVQAGLAKAGRETDEVEYVCPVSCAINPDREKARNWGRVHLAFYANVSYYDIVLDLHGFGKEAQAIRAAFARGDRMAAWRAVTDEMLDTFMLAGTEAECRDKVRQWVGCADVLSLRHTYFDPAISSTDFFQAYESMLRFAREFC